MVWAFTTTGSVWPHTAPAIAAVTRSNTVLIERHAEEGGRGGKKEQAKPMCSACVIGVNGKIENIQEHTEIHTEAVGNAVVLTQIWLTLLL